MYTSKHFKAISGSVLLTSLTLLLAVFMWSSEVFGDTWTQKADMPTARVSFSTAVVNGKIYAIGGADSIVNISPVSVVQEYDPAADRWTWKADMPTARQGFSTSVINGKIYALGGGTNPWPETISISAVEEYDPATDTWAAVSDLPSARRNLSASAVNGRIYAIGGRFPLTTTLSLVEEYTPEGWPFAVSPLSPQDKLPTMWGGVKKLN